MAVTPYTLHGAYAAASGSEEVYTQSIAPLVRLAAAGGLGTVIAYGQTGSGKTFTIRALQRLAAAELLAADGGGGGLWVSFFENMGDKCFDLLNGRAPLVLRDDGKGEMSVVGLAERSVGSADEFDELLAAGNALRATKATQSNDQSSRSHALCTLRLGGPAGGKLQLDVVEHDAARIGEMQQINSSLGTLKECIRANLRRATDEPNAHIPYRNSKLTMLLRAAFEHSRVGAGDGDGASAAPRSAVCFAAHVSPLRSQAKHTANTLEYAAQMLQATMAERQRAEFDEVTHPPPSSFCRGYKSSNP
ncbi:P-loop containing nucleoside triphosphate hydrolase protein [Pavlovales sp. CCMP2436]|nr:P-loop containing nucleoside triphosphate hydrolase protein [Pavlovales sp. CCMP2436]